MRNFYYIALITWLGITSGVALCQDHNPPFESLPEYDFIPVVMNVETEELHWMNPEQLPKNLRRGIHSYIVKHLHNAKPTDIKDLNLNKQYIAGGFWRVADTIYLNITNSFNSETFNVPYNEQHGYQRIRVLVPEGRKRLITAISKAFVRPLENATSLGSDINQYPDTSEPSKYIVGGMQGSMNLPRPYWGNFNKELTNINATLPSKWKISPKTVLSICQQLLLGNRIRETEL